MQPKKLECFKRLVEEIKQSSNAVKAEKILQILSMDCWITHHQDKRTKCVVLATCERFEYDHEDHTCKKVVAENYNVILVPKGYFERNEKKFDVFLCRGHIFLEADLKSIKTTNKDTIGNRIKEGSEQSSRIILDIIMPIKKLELIDGLKTGCERNNALIEIMLFYNSSFYRLKKDLVLSKNIYNYIK